ncbi:uncharacterized protein LOC106418179 [Brassica napus]|uniref:uncharacterized protein LOC106418179 n=1 Tax=Brassica napus TaxID=3708 RepID=UPI000BBE6C9E|nr:uncharacterized protein LOC106418179 [Brassica napus]
MELLAGNCRKRVGGDFDKMLTHSMSVTRCMVLTVAVHRENSRNDDVLATLAGLASPPQKLEPIRSGQAAGDRCFEAILWDDVEESGQLTRGFAKGELEMEIQGRVSRDGTSWDVVSLSSSVDRDEHSSPPGTLGEAGERIHREEAWRQQEIERIKETRKQEMSRSSSLISFIKSVIGEEIEITNLS